MSGFPSRKRMLTNLVNIARLGCFNFFAPKVWTAMFDIHTKLRKQFPLFQQETGLAYLDNAASSQKPQRVIDRICHYYSYEHANVHRGVYRLAEQATQAYEDVRKKV